MAARTPGASQNEGGVPVRNEKPARKKPPLKMNMPTSPEAMARLERDTKCMELRRAGLQWDAIAKQLGYSSPGHAHDRFMVLMKEYPREAVDEAREVELHRYDQLQDAIWAQCVNSDEKNQHWAIDRVLKLMDQRARLMGWNKPVRQEVSVITENAVDTAIRELQTQLELRAAAAGVKLPTTQ
jgi:hypothetical protein